MFTINVPFGYQYRSVAAYNTDIFILNPPSNPALDVPFQNVQRERSSRLSDFKRPKNIKDLAPEEWAPAKAQVKAYVHKMAAAVSRVLRNLDLPDVSPF
jgi:hypothetical protein